MKDEVGRARTIDLYGVTLLKSGNFTAASQCFDQAQKIVESVYGPFNPYLATILTHQGDLLRSARDNSGARLRYLKALAILQHAHDLAHLDVMGVAISIGHTFMAEGKAGTACTWFEQAAAVGAALSDRDNPALIIPDLMRLRVSLRLKPVAYAEVFERATGRFRRIYGSQADKGREGDLYFRSYLSPESYSSGYGWLPLRVLLYPVIGMALGAGYYAWDTNGSVSSVRTTILPVLIVIEVVIALSACLRIFLIWRMRRGRPIGFIVDAEKEFQRFREIQQEHLGFDLSLFPRFSGGGDHFANLGRADINLMAERYGKAVGELTQMLASPPTDPALLRRRALAYLDGEHEDQAGLALADLDEAESLDPGTRFAQLLFSRAFNALDRAEEAVAAADKVLEADQDEAEAWHQRAVGYLALENCPAAIADIDRAIELGSPRLEAILLRGLANMALERIEECLADFSEILAAEPAHQGALIFRGMGHRSAGAYDAAIADLTRAVELDPRAAWALAERGETYRLIGRHEEALADLDRAIGQSTDSDEIPDPAGMIGTRGQIHQALRRYEEAIVDLSRAIELDPDLVWAIADRSETYRRMGRYQEGLADVERAIQISSDPRDLLARRGQLYQRVGRYEEALVDLDSAIDVDPEDGVAYAIRGETYRLMARYEDALADIDRAFELNADFEDLNNLMEMISTRWKARSALERYEDALADLTRLIELDPGQARPINDRSEMHRLMGRYPEALADIERAIELSPDWAVPIATRGQIHHALGRYSEAVVDLTRSIELEPELGEAYAHRARAYLATGRLDAAVADLTKAISLAAEPVADLEAERQQILAQN